MEGEQISTQLARFIVLFQIKVDDDSLGNDFSQFFVKARESRGDGWSLSYSFRGEIVIKLKVLRASEL